MKSAAALNYRHLHYFWVVAKAGGITRAADRLGIAVQTVSAQVRELERTLGHALLAPAGRGVTLTEAGRAAMRQADQIFQLGEQLPAVVRDAATTPSVRLAVGVADGLPKLLVHRLLQPVLAEPNLRLRCQEDGFEALLGELALHRFDVVLADRPAPPNANLKLYSHALGAAPLAWYGTPALAATARRGFPRSLAMLPMLLPTTDSVVRAALDHWLERHGIRARIAGEFDDSALLKTFGASGMGIFPAVDWVRDELVARYGVRRIGDCDGVEERLFAIGTEKKVAHPLVQRLLATRR